MPELKQRSDSDVWLFTRPKVTLIDDWPSRQNQGTDVLVVRGNPQG